MKRLILCIFLVSIVFFLSCAGTGRAAQSGAAPRYKSVKDAKTVNIFCYHRFIERKKMLPKHRKKNGQGDIYSIRPDNFREHLEYFKESCNVITIQQLLDYLDGKADIPDNAVIISIDDGYKSSYSRAYKMLEEYGFKAVYFLYSNFLPGGRNAFTKSIVKELYAGGYEIGSHSYSHPVLPKKRQYQKVNGKKRRVKLEDDEYFKFLEKETRGSKKYIERYTKVPVRTFAYPYGAYSNEVIPFVKKSGYKAAFSVVPSYNTKYTNRFALKRYIIYNTTDVDDLKEWIAKRPLDAYIITPVDGAVSSSRRPLLKAKILEDSHLNTATIKFQMGRVVLGGSEYDQETKTISFKYTKKISWGVHNAKVIAKGFDGKNYEKAWSFVVKTPVSKKAFAAWFHKNKGE